jgi:tRNA dimethylallyltransferase
LYVRALVDQPGYQDQPPDPEVRREILEEIAERGSNALFGELKAFDPEGAEKIHPNNIPRLVRALEVVRIKKRPFSESVKRDQQRRMGSENNWKIIGLTIDRDLLYSRINRRVDQMIDAGWLDEVKKVLDSGASGNEKPLHGLGYRDIVQHLKGHLTLDEAVEKIKMDTRRFAKRQMTFFRKIDGVQWIELLDKFDPDEVAKQVLSLVE